MGIYNQLMDQLTDKGALFNVSTDRLTTVGGIEVPNKNGQSKASSEGHLSKRMRCWSLIFFMILW